MFLIGQEHRSRWYGKGGESFVQKKLTFEARILEFSPPPSGRRQQEKRKPPQFPSMMPPPSQQKRKNSQDPTPHWCWSPTKVLEECAEWELRGTDWGRLKEVWWCSGAGFLTADAGTGRGRKNPEKSGKKKGLGPPQTLSSSQLVRGNWLILKSRSCTRGWASGKASTLSSFSSNVSVLAPRFFRKTASVNTV